MGARKRRPLWGRVRIVSGLIVGTIGLPGYIGDLGTWSEWLGEKGWVWNEIHWFLLVIAAGLLLWPWPFHYLFEGLQEKNDEEDGVGAAPAEELRGSYICNKVFRIGDATSYGILEHRRFEDCTIYGPGMLIPSGPGVQLLDCTLTGPLDAICWEAPTGPRPILGAIAADDVTFQRCTFVGIGFFFPKEQIEYLKAQAAAGRQRMSTTDRQG